MAILKSKLSNHKSHIETGNELNETQREKILAILKNSPEIGVGGKVIDNISDRDIGIENVYYGYENMEWCDSEIYHFEKYDAQLTEEARQKLLEL